MSRWGSKVTVRDVSGEAIQVNDAALDRFVANRGGRKAALKKGGRRTKAARGRKGRGKAEARAQAYVNAQMAADAAQVLANNGGCYFYE